MPYQLLSVLTAMLLTLEQNKSNFVDAGTKKNICNGVKKWCDQFSRHFRPFSEEFLIGPTSNHFVSLYVPESLTPCLLWDLTDVTLACVWRFMQPLQKSPNLSLPYPLPVLTAMLLMPEQNKSHVVDAVFWHCLAKNFLALSDHFKRKILLIKFFWQHLLPQWGRGVRGSWCHQKWSYQFSRYFRPFFVIKILYLSWSLTIISKLDEASALN